MAENTEKAAETTPAAKTEEKKAAAKLQGKGGVYYLVNPAGAIHSVDKEHARGRLALAGWRLASEEEIALFKAQRVQRHDAPIAPKWTPDPDRQIKLPGE